MTLGSRLVILAAAVSLQGCLKSTVLLQVAPDGTGRAVLTSQINISARAAFEQSHGVAPDAARKPETLIPEPKLADLAESFGARVRIVSSTVEASAASVVRTTTLAFDDITQVTLPFPPISGEVVGTTTSFAGTDDEVPIRFAMRLHENGDRLLIVVLPDQSLNQDDSDPSKEPPMTPSERERLLAAVKGSALRLFVELDVPVLRTNAPASDGNRVTILDFDFERMLRSDALEKFDTSNPRSMQELLWTLSDIPGVTVPTEHEVFLEFEAPPQSPQPVPPPAPDTEVYLAPLTIDGDRIEIGAPANISNSPGYDNQPSFTRDGSSILFTSGRGGGQTDIYRYVLSGQRVSQVTGTPESEYSPTETPDGGLSVVRVEADGTQRLWQFTADGRDPRVVLEAIKPVGYHAWADDRTLALFVLGQRGTNQPSTLHIADARTGTAKQIATDIGRSLSRIPGTTRISFVQREKSGDTTSYAIKELDPATGSMRTLAMAVAGEGDVDCAWTPDGTLLMARNDRLYAWRETATSRGGADWREIVSLERLGLHRVTRLAVSPKGTSIALVATPN